MANAAFMVDLQMKVREIMELVYDVQDIDRVPTKQDATFGEKASAINAACLFIDIRNSSTMLQKFRRSSVANLLKSFHYICVKTVKENCGEVRSFNGDSNLAIFTESSCCNNAVSSAFAVKYYLNRLLKPKYPIADNLDYGIGIDFGKVFVVKVGYSGEFNNDLIWIGDPVNMAAKMGNEAKAPKNIHITETVYKKLNTDNKEKPVRKNDFIGNLLGIPPKIWEDPIQFFPFSDDMAYKTDYERPL
jgi:class 3 adenylate cyclase